MMKIDLTGKIALVTGATGQLGRVMAKTLGMCGADLVVHYHKNQQKATALQEEITALGVRCMTVSCDLASLEQVLAMRDLVADQMGDPDILVNNAVSQYQWTSVLEQPTEDYAGQFETCVLQNVHMAKAFVPAMIRKQYGRIIAINTECAMQCFVNQSAYVSGKRGMDGVLRVLAKEIGEFAITVNQVAPGWTVSERDRENHSEVQPESDWRIPLKRRGTDQEVANAVAFLASDLASYISGTYLPVCGGNVMPTI